ncbi:unnamed protein product [Parajaminaea phylloscopi]
MEPREGSVKRQRCAEVLELDRTERAETGASCSPDSASTAAGSYRDSGEGAGLAGAGLAGLYDAVPSPHVSERDAASCPQAVAALIRSLMDREATQYRHLETRLHPYQRRAIAAMLLQEYGGGPVEGGILCEEMGTGKTLECLALILLTRGSLPSVPPEASHGLAEEETSTVYVRSTLPAHSLRAMCIKRLRLTTTPSELCKTNDLPAHIADDLWASIPYYHHVAPYKARAELARHSTAQIGPPKLTYLSQATLVVTPATLVSHWTCEIAQHVPSLRVLVLSQRDRMPNAEDLASRWDVVLLAFERFAKETAVEKAGPFFQCRFRRLIIDEGNKLAGQSRVVDGAASLNVGARWVVSGTPTDLLVSQGNASDWTAVEQATSRSAIAPPQRPPLSWTKQEKRDVDERLYRLLVVFLRTPPFYDVSLIDYGCAPLHGAKRRWNDAVVAKLFPPGQRPSEAGLRYLYGLLCQTMVRNRPSDVARDRPLPPLTRHYVAVELSDTQRKTYNAIQALISANAVLSKREGHDYFFHPVNRKYLVEIITNLSLACFYFASPDRTAHVREAVQLLTKSLHLESWRGDAELSIALANLTRAADDEQWQNEGEDIAYRVQEMDARIVETWCPGFRGQGYLTARTLSAMQDAFVEAASQIAPETQDPGDVEEFITEEMLTAGAKDCHARAETGDAAARAVRTQAVGLGVVSHVPKIKVPHLHRGRKRWRADDAMDAFARLPSPCPKLSGAVTGCTSTKMTRLLNILAQQREPTLIFSSMDNTLYEISAILDVMVLYDERFRHRIFTSGVSQSVLDGYVVAFKEGSVSILLIKTDKGARGLDLHRATVVIFAEPEGSPAVERQAIKRAWRQGQQREVNVYYLFARGTFEEEVTLTMQKRDASGNVDEEQPADSEAAASGVSRNAQAVEGGVAALLRDPVMREFVANPRYVEPPPPSPSPSSPSFHFGLFGPRDDRVGDCLGVTQQDAVV